jgi:hypothetical protein
MPNDTGEQPDIPMGVLRKVRGELVDVVLSIQEQLSSTARL